MKTVNEPRFKVGTTFSPRSYKTPKICTVIDILRTFDKNNDLVKVRYVATHEFAGSIVTDYDVVDTTIATGLNK